MRKVFNILVALIPAMYLGGMAAFLYIMPEDEVLFAVLAGTILLSMLLCIAYSVNSPQQDKKALCITNLWIIGGNLLLFLAEIIWLIVSSIQVHIATQNGGMEGGLGLFLLIIFYMPHWISYLICRITAAVHCCRALRGICSSGQAGIYAILHIIPVLDIVSASLVLKRVKTFQCSQQPPIET